MSTVVTTPFYPLGVDVPNYVPNTMSSPAILTWFVVILSVILASTYIMSQRLKLTRYETGCMLWFVLCGFIHLILEGYYSLTFSTIAGSLHPLAQAMKEYALADSRYVTSDPFLVIMESVTAFLWGPICFLIAFFIVNDHPLRLPLIIIVSVGQIYGDIMYYGIFQLMDALYDVQYSRPEAYYFYGYYVFMNAFWIVIPLYILWVSVCEVRDTYATVQQALRRQALARKAAKEN